MIYGKITIIFDGPVISSPPEAGRLIFYLAGRVKKENS